MSRRIGLPARLVASGPSDAPMPTPTLAAKRLTCRPIRRSIRWVTCPTHEMAAMMQMDDTARTGMVLFDQLEWRNTAEGNAAGVGCGRLVRR